jgi:hypothetical protein
MMNSELNNYQNDWLAQADELNDIEASQVNGGASPVGSVSGGQAAAPQASMGGGQASSGATEAAAMQPMQPESSSERMEATMRSMLDAMSR